MDNPTLGAGTGWSGESWSEKGTERPVWQKKCDLPFDVTTLFLMELNWLKFSTENFFFPSNNVVLFDMQGTVTTAWKESPDT